VAARAIAGAAALTDTTSTIFHHIAVGDRGTVPVEVIEDLGDVLKVLHRLPVGGGVRYFLYVRRVDFVPAAPVAP
jgi:hypothetical protein